MFTDAISIGATYTLAARYAKVSPEAVEKWLREGRREVERRENGEGEIKANEVYVGFLRAVQEAEADAGITWQTTVNNAAKVDPAWAYKMLRLRFGKGYMENDVTTNIQVPADMPTEFLDRIIAGEDPLNVISEYNAYQSLAASSASLEAKKTKRKS